MCVFVCKNGSIFSPHRVPHKVGIPGREITDLLITYRINDTHDQIKLSNGLNPQPVRLAEK